MSPSMAAVALSGSSSGCSIPSDKSLTKRISSSRGAMTMAIRAAVAPIRARRSAVSVEACPPSSPCFLQPFPRGRVRHAQGAGDVGGRMALPGQHRGQPALGQRNAALGCNAVAFGEGAGHVHAHRFRDGRTALRVFRQVELRPAELQQELDGKLRPQNRHEGVHLRGRAGHRAGKVGRRAGIGGRHGQVRAPLVAAVAVGPTLAPMDEAQGRTLAGGG